jgi:endonuclease III
MKTRAEAAAILRKLERQHPNADTELDYRNAFELLVATILSAQTTDVGVNAATPALFERYPDARALAAADSAEVEALVKRTGFFRQKARAIIGMSQALVDAHDGNVPADMDAMVRLPGVGRKTANVVLAHALGVPGLPVDRHVLRVSNRIGLASGDDPEAVEAQLNDLFPPRKWQVVSDSLILHGRRVCNPQPLCDRCSVRAECDAYRTGAVTAKVSKVVPGREDMPRRVRRPATTHDTHTSGKKR